MPKRHLVGRLNSLRTKMILWALVFVLPIFILLVVNTNKATESYETQMQSGIQKILEPFAREIDVTLDSAKRYVASKKLDLTPLAQNSGADEQTRLAAIREIGDGLAKDMAVQSLVDAIFIYEQDSLQFVLNYDRDYGQNSRAADHLEALLDGRDFSTPLFQQGFLSFEVDGEYYIYIAIDVEGGVFGLWFNGDTLLEALRETGVDGMAVAMFTDHTGRMLNAEFNTPSAKRLTELLSGYLVVRERLTIAPFTLTALMDRDVVFAPFRELTHSMFLILALAALLLVFYFAFLQGSIIKPLGRLTRALGRIREGDFRPIAIRDNESTEIRNVFQSLNAATREIESLKIRVYEEKLVKQNTQMQLFQLQLRPHFLLNALNTILSFARADQYEMIQKMTLCLANHCRYILYNNWFVTVEEELVYTQNYIDMQSMQHNTGYHYIVDAEDELLDREIPILGVQIFVENALKHSRDIAARIKITVSITEVWHDSLRCLRVVIDDTGVGFGEEVLVQLNDPDWVARQENDRGIGIENVRQRLQLLYDGMAEIYFSNNEQGGAHVEMYLPAERMKGGTNK